MRLVTWNINSVRLRTPLIEQFVKAYDPDVICFQEIKCQNDQFPGKFFDGLGYEHQAVRGMKAYHGVATVSRLPIERDDHVDWCQKGDARHVATTLKGGVTIHNFYVPAGGDVADVEANDKFAHKLDFLDEMIEWGARKNAKKNGPAIVVGDLNVAPHEEDVWSHKQLLKVVSHTPPETDRMKAFLAGGEWIDVMREFVPMDEKLYTWWSYRAKDWRAANKGRRLDHVLVTPDLDGKAKRMEVATDARGWEKPSDHAPVIVDFEF